MFSVVWQDFDRLQPVLERNYPGAIQQLRQAAIKRQTCHPRSMLLGMTVTGAPSRINREQMLFCESQFQHRMAAIDPRVEMTN